jgi:hypothetical protein
MWNKLHEVEPSKDTSPEMFARQLVVPRDTATRDRFVRSSWVQGFLRRYGLRENPAELSNLLEHIGWRQRGKTGAIKATQPGGDGARVMKFYIVPGGWEQADWSSNE